MCTPLVVAQGAGLCIFQFKVVLCAIFVVTEVVFLHKNDFPNISGNLWDEMNTRDFLEPLRAPCLKPRTHSLVTGKN